MRILLAFLVGTFLFLDVHAQGCVAIRHFSCGGTSLQAAAMVPGDLTIGTSYRYFRSFRHFRGTHEEVDRVANNTEVVNFSHAMDINLQYAVTPRAYATLTLPFVANVRSSLYEHGRETRHSSFSRGLADARVGMGYWLVNPSASSNFAAAAGVGIKLPTGNHNASDVFYNVGVEGHPEVRPVDQSIQPGDGGVGLTFDFQAYQFVRGGVSLYANGFYLLNPRETNGIRTFRETLSPILENEAITSVPDQYSVRAGASYAPTGPLGASLGLRYEGVPVEDLIGGSAGFRRPGNVVSVEPGVSYMLGGVSLNVSVPITVRRNRPQSMTDLETERLTGQPRNGDAAFADYLINVGFTYRLNTLGNTVPVPETF
jgi:hypothetical protein